MDNQEEAGTSPPKSHQCNQWAKIYLNHGALLEERFRTRGRLKDLENAISDYERAIKYTEPSHNACMSQAYRRLEVALKEFNEKTAKIAPDSLSNKHDYYYKLGAALLERFRTLKMLEDLDSAISNLQTSNELISNGHPDKPAIRSLLNQALGASKFTRIPGHRGFVVSSPSRELSSSPLSRKSTHPPPPSRGHTKSPASRERTPPPPSRGRTGSPASRERTPPPPSRGRTESPASRERTPPPPSRGRTGSPASRERTPPPPSRGRTESPASRERTPPPSRGRTGSPASRERTPPPPSRGRTGSPASRERTPPPPSRGRTGSPASRERTPPPPSRGRTESPASRERTLPPPSRGRTESPASRERTPPPPSRGRTGSPASRERTPPPPSRGRTGSPASRERTPPPPSGGRTGSPASRERTPPPPSRGRTGSPASRERTSPPPSRGRTESPASRERTPPPPSRGRTGSPGSRERTSPSLSRAHTGSPPSRERTPSFKERIPPLVPELSVRETISFMRKDIELTTEDQDYRCIILGDMLEAEFDLHGKATDIDDAILYYQKGVDLTPDHHSDKSSRLMLLGNALRSRFKHFGRIEDLDRATSLHQRAVDLIPEDDPSRLSCLNTLSEIKRLEDFDSAISSLEKSINPLSGDHSDRLGLLITLGMAYRTRFERLGNLEDLNKATSVLQEADKLAADDLPNQLICHYALGDTLRVRFEHFGAPKDMHDAILRLQKAVKSSPDDHPYKSTYLNSLGRALLTHSETSGKIEDLTGAISKLEMAVKLTPAGHAKESHHLHDLGNALRMRFDLLKDPKDLRESISNLQRVVEITPNGHPDKPTHLSSLGVALMARFELYGDHADLETAILLLQDADALTLDSHTNKPSILSNLGKALQKRHERANKLEDLNTAISSLRKATDLAPENRPSNLSHLTDLAVGLQKRYELLGAPADLDSLISSLNKGIARLQNGKPVNAKYFNSLGKALQERYERRGDPDDLDGSISNLDNSITNTPNKNSYKAPRFSNLGSAHSTAFNKSNSLDDLNKSISAHEKAVKLMPHGHPHESHHFLDLGKMLRTREKISGGFGEAELAFSRAAKSTSGNPKKRFEAALEWAKCCKESSKSPLEAYKCVIELLPQIAWVGLDVADQQARLAEIGDVVHDAVAAAIEEKDFKLALEWSEHGRSIVWQNQLSLRTPLDDLRLAHPDLAARFEKISQEMKIPVNDGSLGSKEVTETTEEVAVKHLRLVREWDGIVKEIRSKPNFESFLKPKSISQLDPAAHDGPVVMFNIQENRCDALTLVSDGKDVTVDNTPLENLSKKKVEKLLKQFQDALLSVGIHVRSPRGHRWGSSKTDAKADLTKILRTLWTDVVKPVIESLGEKAKTNARRRTKPTIDGLEYETEAAEDNEPPQIWWCPTGPLAFLPLHGAGLYGEDDDGKGASDFVISSYIPTLSSMLGQDNGYDDSFRLLTVAQPATPYATPIPKTVDEVGRVASFATGISLMELISGSATVRSVSSEMEVSDWVHLACHGEQVTGKSMECGLLLHDRKLTLTEIINLSLRPRADFAFLSACQTAAGDQTIAEESAHLASGMLFAGYRGVIATMWPINDEDGPQIAEDVYKRILKDGKPNRKEAARALHEAVKRLKETSNGDILSWVPFIHLGN